MADPASLTNLKDIVEPAAIAWWPPAPGMVLLGVLVLIWAAVAALLWWRRWHHNAYRREALGELADIARQMGADPTRVDGMRQLSVLLKRVALAAYPRVQVASLAGDQWVAFLDQAVNKDIFSKGPGRLLTSAMTEPRPGDALTAADCDQAVEAVRQWITAHQVQVQSSDPVEAGV